MEVRQLMNQPVVTCRESDSLNHAAGLMWDHDCGALPVVDDEGHAVGMITDRDICMAAYTQGSPIHAVPVGNVMARTVYSVKADDDVAQAEQTMSDHQVRRLPVVEPGGDVVGILSMNDVVQEANRERSKGDHEVTSDEVVSTLANVGTSREIRASAR